MLKALAVSQEDHNEEAKTSIKRKSYFFSRLGGNFSPGAILTIVVDQVLLRIKHIHEHAMHYEEDRWIVVEWNVTINPTDVIFKFMTKPVNLQVLGGMRNSKG